MPKLLLMVPETYDSVTRPIVHEISRQVMKNTGIAADTPILYPDDTEATYQPGSTLTKDSENNFFGHGTRLKISVDEEYDNDRILSSAMYRPENLFVFLDRELSTHIKPAYSHTQVTLTFEHRATDKTAALKWRDDIRARVSMDRDTFMHKITYSYAIPDVMLEILKEIHRLRENQAGYGEDYETYFGANVSGKATKLTNQVGGWETWSIGETQAGIVGWFDFEAAPEKGGKEEGAAWTISFSYRFNYDKPIACVMQYPLMIHNQVISRKYRDSAKPYQIEDHRLAYALSRENFRVFEKGGHLEQYCRPDGIALPSFDEFIPEFVVPGTYRVFTAMLALKPDNLTQLADLTNLTKDYRIHPDVLEFIKGEVPYMTRPGYSVFHMSLYDDVYLQEQDAISVTPDLKVVANRPLNLRRNYHIRMGVVKDLVSLGPEAKERLRRHGRACLIILSSIDCSLKKLGLLPPLLGDNYIPKDAFDKVIEEINRGVISKGNNQNYSFITVSSFFVKTERVEQ